MKNPSLATAIAGSLGLLFVVAIAGGLVTWLTPRPSPPPQAVVADPKFEAMKREAVATTVRGENYLEATSRWNELLAARPNDRTLVMNQAVTVLSWIDHIDQRMSVVAAKDRAMNSRLNREQHDAYKIADRLVVSFSRLPPLSSDSPLAARQALLESGLFEARSHEFQGEDAFKLRKLAAEKLLDHLAKDAKSSFLVSRLIALLPTVKDQWPEGRTRVAESVYRAWKAQPQSMYLQVQSARLLLDNNDGRLVEPLAASAEQSLALPSQLKEAEDLKPRQLADSARQAISAGNWSQTSEVAKWLDMLTKSAAYVEDAKRLQPELTTLLLAQ